MFVIQEKELLQSQTTSKATSQHQEREVETDELVENNELPLFQADIKVHGKSINFEIDTEVAVAIISHENQQKLFSEAICKGNCH